MKKEDKKYGHPRVYEILDELADLHSRKNRDYASEDNPLGNFLRVAEWCKKYNLITPEFEALKVAIIYALKQIDASLKLLGSGEKGLVEGIPERFRDVAVYMIIGEVLYEEAVASKNSKQPIQSSKCMPYRHRPPFKFEVKITSKNSE